jgi:hypothetical protein
LKSKVAGRAEVTFLDPQLRSQLRLVATYPLDEALGVLAADEVSTASPSGRSSDERTSMMT